MKDFYTPLTLPELPRQYCPHEVMFMEKGEGRLYIDAEKCKRPVDPATGWCSFHRDSYELLVTAVAAGCPEVIINGLVIPAGLPSWEGYAQRCIPERYKLIMKILKAKARQREKEMQWARQQAVARMHTDVA
jgi:hypothetical protein